MKNKKLIRTREAADLIGVTPDAVRRKAWLLRGKGLTVGTLVEGYWKYSPQDIEILAADFRFAKNRTLKKRID